LYLFKHRRRFGYSIRNFGRIVNWPIFKSISLVDVFKGSTWDFTVGYDYMPNQFVTFRGEVNHRAADVNYFAGANGVTGPDGTNSNNTGQSPAGWTPDLVQAETRMNFAMLVRF